MKKRTTTISALALAAALLAAGAAGAENWPNWRGPHYNGSAEADNLPAQWSKTENVVWKTAMPGESAATPAVWNEWVFVSSLDERTGELLAMGLDRKTGEIKWTNKVGIDFGNWRRQNKASPSPVTDGERVIFLYGTGDLCSFTLAGEEQWKRNLQEEMGEFNVQFGYAASPLLHDGKLYVVVMQRDVPPGEDGKPKDSFLLAIDPATGKDLWKRVRPSDARRESLEAYTTPIPATLDGKEQIVLFGADYATGHDPDSGEELWRWGGYNPRKITHYRIVPSAVAGGGHVYVAGPKREPLFALKTGLKGTVGDEAVAWKFTGFPPDVCVPLFMDGRLFVFDGDRYVMTCLNPETGETVWQGSTGGDTVYRASPTGGDGKIYVMNEAGLVVVLDAAGDEYKELFRIEMGESPSRASIAISDNQLFIRTAENLYCIANSE